MQIGELADLVGVSTRTIRHYHHVGVLPEPARAGNGYREYGLADAVLLVRARRLTDLGLSLSEVGDVLSGDRNRELDEILAEIEADLTQRETDLRSQRERVGALRARLAGAGSVPDAIAEPGLVSYLAAVRSAGAAGPAVDRDGELLSLIGGGDAAELGALLGAAGDDPAAAAKAAEIYCRFDALAADPAPSPAVVDALVTDLLGSVPPELAARARGQLGSVGEAQLALMVDGLSAGQRQVVEALMRRLDGSPDAG
ncbi:MerR family transcriptional regulator [Nakamurella sp.]|uniref:MerR family transcriptional regulator n=1 Tax=Nakamurella sp. TaxID=1869182 RepID=UPI003783C9F9